MNMKTTGATSHRSEAGFSLLELVMVVAILTIVLASVFNGIDMVSRRSVAEQVKVDLTQQGREFVDEFERDVHQAGYPNCRMVASAGEVVNPTLGPLNCPADSTNPAVANNWKVAAGLVYVSNTLVVFEGDVDGNGNVDSIRYQLVDSAGNPVPDAGAPGAGTCPCKIQRSQMQKVNGTPPFGQPSFYSLELQNVVNSGVPGGTLAYGGGLTIAGNTAWTGVTNDAYYAAVSTFKDYPVFQAYNQLGQIVQLPQGPGSALLNCTPTFSGCIKSIRLTINLLANATTGVDLKTKVRPVTTLVGDARLVNN
jgi:prepilin-type N-terminal cleavage/methylation domain-containing protein